MANVYVRSGATGSGTGADWANAYTTLAAAFAAKAAGDSFWVADDHAETQASALTLTSPGTAANPCYVYCVDRTGSVPPVSADLRTTATITTTGANALAIGAGHTFWYGVAFSAGSGAVNSTFSVTATTAFAHKFVNCAIKKAGTTANSTAIIFGTVSAVQGQSVTLENTTMEFGATGDAIRLNPGMFVWVSTASAIAGASIPTTLFGASSTAYANAVIEGVDFSALGSGKTIFGATGAVNAVIKNCKLGASVTVAATPNSRGSSVSVINTDSSGTNYRHEKYAYAGAQTVETTIVRTGGASDGTTSIAWKIVTTANSKWLFPFESLPIAIWNDTTAANVTVTVYGIWGGGAVPNNDEIWIEVSYMGSSATPIATINTSNTKADNLATGSALASDTSTWGGSTTKFKMEVTLSSPQPAMKGLIYVTVKAAKASSTFYIDPKIVLS